MASIKPILFSGPMVRALLDGRKTQTRRVINPQPEQRIDKAFQGEDGIWRFSWETARAPISYSRNDRKLPIAVDDLLYVREAWRVPIGFDHLPPRDLVAGSYSNVEENTTYIADEGKGTLKGKFRQGMHMPRAFSRLTLKVTDVRVQRLNEISESDADAEGCERFDHFREEPDYSVCFECGGTLLVNRISGNGGVMFDCDCFDCDTYKKRFECLWDSLNGTPRKLSDGTLGPDISWSANPWVVAYTFEVIRGNVDLI